MKKFITLSLALGLVSYANAQSLVVTNEADEVVTGTTINVPGDASALDLGLPLNVVQNSGATANVSVRRYELNVIDSTMNYFCWYECYAPQYAGDIPEWEAPEGVVIASGEEFPGFHAYYRPQGFTGTSCFRYVWYMVNNQNDSAWVDICFAAAPVGISELSARAQRLDAAPNPSSGDVTFQFEASGARRSLVVHNALGALVSTTPIVGTQRKLTLSEGSLPSGMWFASLEVDGRVVAARRFIISGH